MWRSDWKLACRIDYNDSIKMFKNIGNGPILTDAQFAYYLYKNFGQGIYSVLAWRKGREGFWSFINLELNANGFRRVQKNLTPEEKEKNELKRNINKLNNELNDANNKQEKENIKERINNLKEEVDWSDEIIDMDKAIKRGPTPYLKQTQPVYGFHQYEPIYQKEYEEAEINDFW